MASKRRALSAVFNAKVALDAIKGLKTSAELTKTHGVHATQIALWEKQLAWSHSRLSLRESERLQNKSRRFA